jgi:anthranilate synthase component II
MFLLIDNYDSFTYNLWHFLGQLGAGVKVVRNDKITVLEALALKPEGIIISPGPCDPDKAGICLDLIKACPIDMPIFGVCLGHQCIGQSFKAKIIKDTYPMHGKLSRIQHANIDIFADIPQNFLATRYHSLIINNVNLPDSLTVSAKTHDDIIMGISHKTRPIFGVQFHPESIASEYGYTLLANFLKIAGFKVQSPEKVTILEDILRKTA